MAIGDLFALKTRADVKKKHKKELGFTLTAEDLGKYMEDIEAAKASFVLVAPTAAPLCATPPVFL